MYADIDSYDINVCNQALMQMGGKRIAAFSDASVEERDCEAIYTTLRDQVLEAFPWTFAKRRKQLVVSTVTPDFGYSYQFRLPADCLYPLSIVQNPLDTEEPDWIVEGDYLLTDEEEVYLHYTSRVESADKYTPSFVTALSLLMASRLAMSIGKNPKLSNELHDKYIRYIEQDAMVINDRIGSAKKFKPTEYADAR